MTKKKLPPATEIAKTGNTEVAVAAPVQAFGTDNIDSDDLLISKIVVAQGLSKAVTEGDVNLGDIYESLERQILAKGGKTPESLEFIPFEMFKTWLIFEGVTKNGQLKMEYVETQAFTKENAKQAWNEEINGVMIQRHLVQNYLVILPSDINKGQDEVFPYVLPFKRTGMQAGKFISTVVSKEKAKGNGAAIAEHIFSMSRKLEDGKLGTYFKPEVKVARKTTEMEKTTAFNWWKRLSATSYIVDDSEEKEASGNKTNTTVDENSEY